MHALLVEPKLSEFPCTASIAISHNLRRARTAASECAGTEAHKLYELHINAVYMLITPHENVLRMLHA
jgi:hypothetical protein